MTTIHNRATRRQLSQTWREWSDIVRRLVEKPSASGNISEATYGKVHQEMTALLRQRTSEADSQADDLCNQMSDVIRPWMALSVLRDADEWIRKDVLRQCQNCQREIDASEDTSATQNRRSESAIIANPATDLPVKQRSAWGFTLFLLLFLAVVVIGLGSEFWSDIRQFTWIGRLMDGLVSSWREMTRTDDVSFKLVRRVTVVIVVLTAWAVFRRPRNF